MYIQNNLHLAKNNIKFTSSLKKTIPIKLNLVTLHVNNSKV
jgi:hypothetical protein